MGYQACAVMPLNIAVCWDIAVAERYGISGLRQGTRSKCRSTDRVHSGLAAVGKKFSLSLSIWINEAMGT